MSGVPVRLLNADPPVVRPRDAGWWRNPAKELARLAAAGVVATPVHGHYVVPPPARMGDSMWRPTLEGFALAVAQRTVGAADAALMGISAARVHGALPRAVGTAVVAMPHRHRPLRTAWGTIVFVARDVAVVDVEATATDLTGGWVTTIEQTLLDVVARPTLGGLDELQVREIVTGLDARVDWDRVEALAMTQRRQAVAARARALAVDPGQAMAPRRRSPDRRGPG